METQWIGVLIFSILIIHGFCKKIDNVPTTTNKSLVLLEENDKALVLAPTKRPKTKTSVKASSPSPAVIQRRKDDDQGLVLGLSKSEEQEELKMKIKGHRVARPSEQSLKEFQRILNSPDFDFPENKTRSSTKPKAQKSPKNIKTTFSNQQQRQNNTAVNQQQHPPTTAPPAQNAMSKWDIKVHHGPNNFQFHGNAAPSQQFQSNSPMQIPLSVPSQNQPSPFQQPGAPNVSKNLVQPLPSIKQEIRPSSIPPNQQNIPLIPRPSNPPIFITPMPQQISPKPMVQTLIQVPQAEKPPMLPHPLGLSQGAHLVQVAHGPPPITHFGSPQPLVQPQVNRHSLHPKILTAKSSQMMPQHPSNSQKSAAPKLVQFALAKPSSIPHNSSPMPVFAKPLPSAQPLVQKAASPQAIPLQVVKGSYPNVNKQISQHMIRVPHQKQQNRHQYPHLVNKAPTHPLKHQKNLPHGIHRTPFHSAFQLPKEVPSQQQRNPMPQHPPGIFRRGDKAHQQLVKPLQPEYSKKTPEQLPSPQAMVQARPLPPRRTQRFPDTRNIHPGRQGAHGSRRSQWDGPGPHRNFQPPRKNRIEGFKRGLYGVLFGRKEPPIKTIKVPVERWHGESQVIPKTSPLANQFMMENDSSITCQIFTNEVCLESGDYPFEIMMNNLARNRAHVMTMYADVWSQERQNLVEGVTKEDEASYNYQHYYGTDAHSYRDYGTDGGFICPSEIKYAKPKRGKRVDNQWKFIVNLPDFPQTVRMERCLKPTTKCSYVFGHLDSQCVQVHSLQRFLVWDMRNGFHIDMLKIPTTCKCHLRKTIRQMSAEDIVSDSTSRDIVPTSIKEVIPVSNPDGNLLDRSDKNLNLRTGQQSNNITNMEETEPESNRHPPLLGPYGRLEPYDRREMLERNRFLRPHSTFGRPPANMFNPNVEDEEEEDNQHYIERRNYNYHPVLEYLQQ